MSAPWLTEVAQRLHAFVALPEDWDSYGAGALQPGATAAFLAFLLEYHAAILSVPLLAPTDGGIYFELESEAVEVSVTFEPSGEPEVCAEVPSSGTEWCGPISEYRDRLPEWLRAASTTTSVPLLTA